MRYDVGLPLALAPHVSVADVLPAVDRRLVGALGDEAVAGVTVSWSTLDSPWSETASWLMELTPALRCTCSAECWYTSKLPVMGKLWFLVITTPLTRRPICRLLTPGKRPPWNA